MEWTPEESASLERLANYLESGIMPCPLGREALLAFLREQILALRQTPPPDSVTATQMIDNAYVLWMTDTLDLE